MDILALVVIAIIGDTHMPKGSRRLPDRCVELLRASDLIVHTGDFSGPEALELFRGLGPELIAVHGNVDAPGVAAELPEAATLMLGECRIGLIHDGGAKRGRLERMRRRFSDADAVVFGHSHLPLHERADERDAGSFQIFNPGSPTERRRAPQRSLGTLELGPGGELRFTHVLLD